MIFGKALALDAAGCTLAIAAFLAIAYWLCSLVSFLSQMLLKLLCQLRKRSIVSILLLIASLIRSIDLLAFFWLTRPLIETS